MEKSVRFCERWKVGARERWFISVSPWPLTQRYSSIKQYCPPAPLSSTAYNFCLVSAWHLDSLDSVRAVWSVCVGSKSQKMLTTQTRINQWFWIRPKNGVENKCVNIENQEMNPKGQIGYYGLDQTRFYFHSTGMNPSSCDIFAESYALAFQFI